MDTDYLVDWAKRAACDLQEYAEEAEKAGSPQPATKALIKELDDLLAGRPTWWRYQNQRNEKEETLLDAL